MATRTWTKDPLAFNYSPQLLLTNSSVIKAEPTCNMHTALSSSSQSSSASTCFILTSKLPGTLQLIPETLLSHDTSTCPWDTSVSWHLNLFQRARFVIFNVRGFNPPNDLFREPPPPLSPGRGDLAIRSEGHYFQTVWPWHAGVPPHLDSKKYFRSNYTLVNAK